MVTAREGREPGAIVPRVLEDEAEKDANPEHQCADAAAARVPANEGQQHVVTKRQADDQSRDFDRDEKFEGNDLPLRSREETDGRAVKHLLPAAARALLREAPNAAISPPTAIARSQTPLRGPIMKASPKPMKRNAQTDARSHARPAQEL